MREAALRRVRSIGGWKDKYGNRWENLLQSLVTPSQNRAHPRKVPDPFESKNLQMRSTDKLFVLWILKFGG